jgi:hypothetical protein
MSAKYSWRGSNNEYININPDVQAQILQDSAYVVMDAPIFFNKIKNVTITCYRYAQVLGSLMIIGISFLPHHELRMEEILIHNYFYYLLVMQLVLRSFQNYFNAWHHQILIVIVWKNVNFN